MSQRSRFFDSVAGDRTYTSDAWAQVTAALQSTGIVPGLADQLEVVEDSPPAMSVRVKTGIAFILGYYFEVYSGLETLVIAAADATNPRIDRIVVRRSLTNREAVLAVVQGTPAASPSAPALTQNTAGTYEIPLAQVAVPALASSITNSNISDERGTRSQGYDLVAALNTSTGHDHDGADSAAVAYANISGKPSSFAPSAHTHADGSTGGTVAYSVITGKPSSFTPSSHTHADAGNGGVIDWGVISGKPSTFAPSSHDIVSGHSGSYPWASISGKPATFAPSSHAYTDHSGTVPWSELSSVPSTFEPNAHADHHATGGSDPVTPSAIRAWATSTGTGAKIFVGTGTPASPAEGDIWVKA